MLRLLIFALAFVAAALQPQTALSQEPQGDKWVLLGSFDVTPGAASDRVDLTASQGRSKSIRLEAVAGAMTLSRIVIGYANGQWHFEDFVTEDLISLRLKDRSRQIDPRKEERFVDFVEVVYAPGIKPVIRSKMAVWGLQSPAGIKAQREGAVAAKEVLPPAEPFATKALSLALDRDVLEVSAGTGPVSRIRFRARDRHVEILGAELVEASGQSQSISVNAALEPGEYSEWIKVKTAALKSVRLSYRPNINEGGIALVEIFGDEGPSAPRRKPRGIDGDKTAGAEPPYVEVPVFFGTDRKAEAGRQKNGKTLANFSGQGDTELKLGRAVVTIPTAKDRQQGAIPRPEWYLVFTSIAFRDEDPAIDFTLQAVDVLSEDAFAAEVKSRMEAAKVFKDQAFVFVHGYNVLFDDGLFRTAQIAHDIGFDGAAFLYSWPSIGRLLGYNRDQKRVLGSRDNFRKFLDIVRKNTGAKKIHLIAHSMGSVLLSETLREFGGGPGGAAPQKIFSEIVFAAPDVTRDNFTKITERIKPLAAGITLYASASDKALEFSGGAALGETPAGYVPEREGPLVVNGVDTIDVSDISTDFFALNHAEFADRKPLLKDMELLLSKGVRPPKTRLGIFEEIKSQIGTYWKYRP